MYSLGLSLFYAITISLLFLTLTVIKKTDNKLNLVLCLPVYGMFVMLYTAFFAGVIDVIGIPVNLLSIGIGNLLAATGLGAYTIKSKKIQLYKFNLLDLLVLVGLAVFTAILAISQFDANLMVNFETTDPSRHMRYAQALIETQSLGKMYFASFNNAMFISFGLGFVKTFWAYKLFILSEIMMFLLSACIMYCLARQFAKTATQKIISAIFILFYLACYPLNNMVFGYVYLGIGVSIAAFMIILSKCYEDGEMNKIFNIIALMLGAYGIITCYSLFAPFVYIAVAVFIAIKFIKEKRLFSKEFFATEFGIFLIPTVMGVYYSFFKMFAGDVSNVTSSIAVEGYIYRDLYSAFIVILPFTIYGIINAFITKGIKCQHILLIILSVTTITMFYLGMQGRVSSYYFYKMYYILSMVCFAVAIEGICDLCKKSITVVLSYMMVWTFLAAMCFGGIDSKITGKKVLMSPSSKSGTYFSIISFNKQCMQEGNFSVERMQLYEESHNKIKEGSKVTLLSTTEPIYWFEAMVQCELKEFYCYDFDACDIESYMNSVEKCDYVVVYADHDTRFDEYISEWEAVYQNAAGTIYSVK